jgi:integrase
MNKEGLVHLMIRMTFLNNKVDKATGYYVDPDQWNSAKQRLKGSKDTSKQINEWIDGKMVEISDIYKEEVQKNKGVHLPTLMEKLFSGTKEEVSLLKFILKHNEQLKQRVNKDFAFSTFEKYVFTYNKVKAFVESYLKRKDILMKDVTTKFIMDFDHYLRVVDSNQHNTAVKYCINLKRIFSVAALQGLIVKNPLTIYKTVYKDTQQIYLSEQEVNAVEDAELVKTSHLLVRDLFIFQCNTGLAYTDMVNLKSTDISIDNNGRKWIIKPRQKSGIVSTIPLLPKALKIIDKYSGIEEKGEALLPHYSIQKYNQYIGEVGDIAKLNKKLSSHVARRSFGNVALAKGISLNVISKILGHSSTLITQRIYAITTQKIIDKEIDKW